MQILIDGTCAGDALLHVSSALYESEMFCWRMYIE
jgi:hypothetical protein